MARRGLPLWAKIALGGGAAAAVLLILAGGDDAQARPSGAGGPDRPGGACEPGSGALACMPELGDEIPLIDRTDQPIPPSFKGRASTRDPSKVDTIVVHQTDVAGGFGLTPQQIQAAGGDQREALLRRYQHTPYHAIASPRPGRRLSVVQWGADRHTYHGHASNPYSIGWAYDGSLPGDELDVALGRASFAHAVATARAQGAPIRYVEAHRQHAQERAADPGAEIWSAIVLPLLEPLGLELSDRISGTGLPIPASWS